MGSDEQREPGMYVSFDSLLRELSSKLDTVQKAITDEIGNLRREIAAKASKEHVDAVEARLRQAHDALCVVVDKQGDEIVDLRVEGGSARGVSTTTLVFLSIGAAGIFAILAALVYVIAQGHGG